MTPAPRARTLPAVLFDMDGTLLDSIALIVESAVFAFEGREGPRPTRAEWQALIGTPLDSMLARWATGPDDVEFLRARYRRFQVDHHDRFVRLYDGVADVVRELHARGHPLAIVSSKLDRGIRRSMDHFKLTPYFDAIVGIESTTNHKPHPEPVHFALARLGIAAHEAVFVGDSPHDVEAARAAGVRVVAVTWGAYSRAEIAPAGPDAWADRMADLPREIARAR
ncbi:MAG TPA: HAD-IA family hydrolase [Gemmatimonadaceae bacterium]|nr:HAD-IA family hydrolase [Gemmatimonadaceae bacterium]